jgi:hypothetical protein
MPSPYDYMQNRWLTWHERWPVPEIESLKRQIDCIKAEIVGYENVRDISITEENIKKANDIIATLREVLATLERLMPPF